MNQEIKQQLQDYVANEQQRMPQIVTITAEWREPDRTQAIHRGIRTVSLSNLIPDVMKMDESE